MVETSGVKKILYITMSNLGDAMMGLPTFDFLRRECPQAKITVVTGPRTRCVFENHPDVSELIIYDKHSSLRQKIDLFFRLKKQEFDVVVDLRDTFYRWGLKVRYKNPVPMIYPKWVVHSNQKHLYKAVAALKRTPIDEDEFLELNTRRNPSFISVQDQKYVESLLERSSILAGDEFILVVPGARSQLKKWPIGSYGEVIKEIRTKYGYKVVVTGQASEKPIIEEMLKNFDQGVLDFSGMTNFGQLCSLVYRSKLVICNDSGVLHIASYLEKPVVGIYGPSNPREYGPWSKRSLAVHKNVLCAPCGKAHCRYDKECIQTIRPYDVMLAVWLILEGEEAKVKESRYRRILVVRTDRIGDVLISTPVLKVLRDHYPTSFIAMMVAAHTKDLVDGNPYLDRVIVFDKDKQHRGLFGTLGMVRELKKQGFDVAIILHPTVRVHLACFLASIKERIGYDRKAPYFLTHCIHHTKQEGVRHEVEYNFDLLKPLGISTVNTELYMPIKESSERFIEKLLERARIDVRDRIVAVNPSASCISKRWSIYKFSEVIDRLATSHHVKVLIVADAFGQSISRQLRALTTSQPLDFSGQLNLSQLASLFKRCALVISNDSGPVHIAVAVGTPVISIFGRNQPGLGPRRWGPLGKSDVVLHKKTPCLPCLAHNCTQAFRCLEAITCEEVLEHAARILGEVKAR